MSLEREARDEATRVAQIREKDGSLAGPVGGECTHPLAYRIRRRDGSHCNWCGADLFGEMKPEAP